MRIPFSLYRQFHSEITFCEQRLVHFGEGAEGGCRDNKCDPKATPPEPVPDPISDVPSSKKAPDFSDMKFDLRPDEPTHIYEKGVVKSNHRSDQIRDMNKEQFQAHLGKMFSKHMGDQMKLEGTRQNQLARGKRKAEARDRFADTKKGRRAAEKWADKALADSDVTYNEAKAEVAKIEATPLFDQAEFDAMLAQITDDIWSTAEFQRGTVNYLKAYDKAWNIYIDLAEQQKNDKGLDDHPFFRSGAFRNRRAPGIYQNGELVRVPSNFPGIGNRPTSTYGAAKVRERGGMSQNPDRDFLKKEEQTVRDGYEQAWRKSFRKKNAGALDSKKEDAFVQKNVDNQLRKQGFQQAKVDASRAPDEDALRLPPEADRKTEQDLVNAHENIDARDRGAVVGTLAKTLGLNVGSVKEFNKKVRLDEVNLLSIGAGMPQVLNYSVPSKVRRGVPDPMKSGLVIVDREDEDAREQAQVRVIDFAAVDRLVHDDDPWKKGFMRDASDAELDVYDQLNKLNPTKNDLYNTGTYQQLIAKSRAARSSFGDKSQAVSPFALDEMYDLTTTSERGSVLGRKLQSIFTKIDDLRSYTSWSPEQKAKVISMIRSSDAADRKILKGILEEHCTVSGGGDVPDDVFKNDWNTLNA